MKILSDFDGVWTRPQREAQLFRDELVREAGRLAGLSAEVVQADFVRFERLVRALPARYGWFQGQRVTAYVDEDPFCLANAMARYLEETVGDERTRPYRRAVLEGPDADVQAFADRCFQQAARRFRDEGRTALVPEARQALAALFETGVELVVASNSPAEKLRHAFSDLGFESACGRGQLRIVGRAGKELLGEVGTTLDVEGRTFEADRPAYRELLLGEAPDVVLGDVFSLDLAQPLALRDAGELPELRLALKLNSYTPPWARRLIGAGRLDGGLEDLRRLADWSCRPCVG